MKAMGKLVALLLSVIAIIMSSTACSVFSNQPSSNAGSKTSVSPKETNVTVQYYDGNTFAYTAVAGAKSIQTNFIAPAGKVIKGLFDENGVQYADYDCIIDLKNNAAIPSKLYARYENVDVSYLDDDILSTYVEDPQKIGFYSGRRTTWEFNATANADDQKLISACLCNPYADIVITVSFQGKGGASGNGNLFTSKLIVCDETIGSFKTADFGSKENYTTYSYTGKIKAKQLTNGNYKIMIDTSAKLGYTNYTIKNYKIDIAFDFE